MKKYILSCLMVLFCLATTIGGTTATNTNEYHPDGFIIHENKNLNMSLGETHTFVGYNLSYDPEYFEEVKTPNSRLDRITLKAIKTGNTILHSPGYEEHSNSTVRIKQHDITYNVHITST
ncbi:MAG: hypothetical protein NKF70_13090 [Methanobacterium sp. ERen5]|nr:MAG: hypothetical protein NKF70_13090 [Methanobacterium sp. ERen5]